MGRWMFESAPFPLLLPLLLLPLLLLQLLLLMLQANKLHLIIPRLKMFQRVLPVCRSIPTVWRGVCVCPAVRLSVRMLD